MDPIKCQICSNVFNRPEMLKCGHSFCRDCILNLSKLECSTCSKEFDPNDNICNFVICHLLDEEYRIPQQERTPCEECYNDVASLWCMNCYPPCSLCLFCSQEIHRHHISKKHNIFSLNKINSYGICENHRQLLKRYCSGVNCMKAICEICEEKDHNWQHNGTCHDIYHIKQYAEAIRDQLREFAGSVDFENSGTENSQVENIENEQMKNLKNNIAEAVSQTINEIPLKYIVNASKLEMVKRMILMVMAF